MTLTRRGLLGAMLAAGVVQVPIAASAQPGSLRHTKRFKLNAPARALFQHKPLADKTVLQSMAFDTPNHRLFTAQLKSGTAASTGTLTLSRLDFAGNVLGQMDLTGFGHGVSIGAQGVGSTSYLWTETDVDTANGRGRQICRFPWQDGATLTPDSASLTKWKPVADGAVFTPAVDQRYGRLGVRYSLADGMHINIYSLAAAQNGDFSTVLTSFKQPAFTPGIDFQGWALYGSYVYFWEGEAYPGGTPDPTKINSKLWCYDLRKGRIVDSFLTPAGAELTHREAEGIAVYGGTDATARLCFGFASGVTGDRRANLFCTTKLV
jgi:hypothetical protein